MFTIGEKRITIRDLQHLISGKAQITVESTALTTVRESRAWLDMQVKDSTSPVYGINTGFGSLCNIRIAEEDLQTLQANLIRSHNCGTGAEVSKEVVRLMLVLKIRSLALGHSGIRPPRRSHQTGRAGNLPPAARILSGFLHCRLPKALRACARGSCHPSR